MGVHLLVLGLLRVVCVGTCPVKGLELRFAPQVCGFCRWRHFYARGIKRNAFIHIYIYEFTSLNLYNEYHIIDLYLLLN